MPETNSTIELEDTKCQMRSKLFGTKITPLTVRRLASFRANKRGYRSFWIFLVLFLKNGSGSVKIFLTVITIIYYNYDLSGSAEIKTSFLNTLS